MKQSRPNDRRCSAGRSAELGVRQLWTVERVKRAESLARRPRPGDCRPVLRLRRLETPSRVSGEGLGADLARAPVAGDHTLGAGLALDPRIVRDDVQRSRGRRPGDHRDRCRAPPGRALRRGGNATCAALHHSGTLDGGSSAERRRSRLSTPESTTTARGFVATLAPGGVEGMPASVRLVGWLAVMKSRNNTGHSQSRSDRFRGHLFLDLHPLWTPG